MKFKRYLNMLVLFSMACFAFAGQTLRAQGTNSAKIADLKTAYFYNFTKNFFWPHEEQLKEFRICVLNSEQLAEQLRTLETKRKFRNRLSFKVDLIRDANNIGNCQMLVVDGSKGDNLWAIYTKIRNKPVLMIAENLEDYKKSMLSFVVLDGKLRFIVNKTKLDESQVSGSEALFEAAITKEGEWKSIVEKMRLYLQSGGSQVKIDKDDIAQMVSEYNSLEKEKKSQDLTIAQMEDSLRSKMQLLNQKIDEYKRVSHAVDKLRQTSGGLQKKISQQKRDILTKETEIGKAHTVIWIIAGSSALILLLLVLAVKANRERRKANALLFQQKNEIEKQKHLVELKQKEILDSISYAKRIQTALMASEGLLTAHLPDHFIFFRPKDIVAGDFYWAESVDGAFLYATADSTGHGVPGAFMSLLNISKLNEAINQKRITRPDLVLNDVRKEIVGALNPQGSTEESKDGMDVVLCRLDTKKMVLQYAAANSSFCIIRNNELLNCPADKMPVGKSHDENAFFTFNEIQLQKGDIIYTFTDGFADQFGGPNGKKLKFKYLRNILVKISALPLDQQKETLTRYFEDWKGSLEQVDDVLLMGVRV
jgi:serine phosphatase RsbU (regulator of sigma subunit)